MRLATDVWLTLKFASFQNRVEAHFDQPSTPEQEKREAKMFIRIFKLTIFAGAGAMASWLFQWFTYYRYWGFPHP